MMSRTNLSDIRGLVQLVIDQAELITDVVEHVHSTVTKPILIASSTCPRNVTSERWFTTSYTRRLPSERCSRRDCV